MVKVADKGSPLFRASVFLNNTSVGTVTDEQGRFVLWIPSGKFELVVSSIGYTTYQQPLSSGTLDSLDIRLHPRASEMEAVVVEAFEKEGWNKWGRFFLEQFIGTSAIAADPGC